MLTELLATPGNEVMVSQQLAWRRKWTLSRAMDNCRFKIDDASTGVTSRVIGKVVIVDRADCFGDRREGGGGSFELNALASTATTGGVIAACCITTATVVTP